MIKFQERRRREKWLYHAIHTHKIMEKNLMFTPENSKLATHPVASCGPNTDNSQLTDPAGVGPKSKDNDLCSSPQTAWLAVVTTPAVGQEPEEYAVSSEWMYQFFIRGG